MWEASPDREGEVPWVALAGPGQETAVDAPGQQELLCLNSSDVGVEPPKKNKTQTHTHDIIFRICHTFLTKMSLKSSEMRKKKTFTK